MTLTASHHHYESTSSHAVLDEIGSLHAFDDAFPDTTPRGRRAMFIVAPSIDTSLKSTVDHCEFVFGELSAQRLTGRISPRNDDLES
ncbi:hypothetical protein [Phyllobacterium zundukense]|uniref:Uncharacterized protein n=1 Tax=Phyllobacterium zundukense TaxID=1867719 RepID=A0ACD4CY14_9HYPH|nr:hypothetical protein [Phyllobacterium zundukense]UXN58497.1 hypothetical protein N8E88_10740 [Phyllobacterium zundukense]